MFILIDVWLDKYDGVITDAKYVSTHKTEEEANARSFELRKQWRDAAVNGEPTRRPELHVIEVPE